MGKFALGLMSGTSADGLTVSAVQVRPFRVLYFKNYPYPPALQKRLLQAFKLKAPQLSELNYALGVLYAQKVKQFLREFHLSARDIQVIGSHGQTIYHGPHDKTPNTLQIGEPSFLAGAFHCPVVSDFRAMDVALGGQGAPLIPFFDEYIFGQKTPVVLLNIGGISNLSVVGKGVKTIGFDVGPGNTLSDLICQKFFKKPFDKNGALAARGTPDKKYANSLLRQPFFAQKPPKSLDKNTFGARYVEQFFPLKKFQNPYDCLATALYFTAAAIGQAVRDFVPKKAQGKMLVSGGGCYNKTLLAYLRECLPATQVTLLSSAGIDPQAKESAAFALFAYLAVHRQKNHCARATGAKEKGILGKVILG